MAAMRLSWSDDRLDDLNRRVGDGFARLDERIDGSVRGLRAEMHTGFAQLHAEIQAGDAQLRAEMNAGFARIDARFDALQRTIIQVGGGLIGTTIVASAAIVATQL